MKKRISAFLLSVVLCLTMICPAFAAAGGEPKITVTVEGEDIIVSGEGITDRNIDLQLSFRRPGGTNWEIIPGPFVIGDQHFNGDTFRRRVVGGRNSVSADQIDEASGYVIRAIVSYMDGSAIYGYWPESKATVDLPDITMNLTDSPKILDLPTVDPEGTYTYTWSVIESTPVGEITVDENGLLTAAAAGKATIKVEVYSLDGILVGSDTCTVIVENGTTPTEVKVEVTPSECALEEGQTQQLTATVSNTEDTRVSWSSNKTDVATVDENGIVTAKGVGTATITATSMADTERSASCVVTVTPKSTTVVSVMGVTLDKSTLPLTVGGTGTLIATVAPSNATNKSVTWKSSNTNIADVDATGKVTAIAVGTATITVTTADGGKTADCTVIVSATGTSVAVTGITLDPTSLTLAVGNTRQVTATVTPANATNKNVTWKSSDESVATVNPTTGLVTAVKAGTATITATTVDGGKTASCAVTVTSTSTPVVPVTGVTLNRSTLPLNVGGTGTLSATVAPTNASNKGVTWKSSNENVASVDATGKVTAKAVGTATITVTTVDGGKTAACTVTVSDPGTTYPGGSTTVARPGESGGNVASNVSVSAPASVTGGSVTISDPNAKQGSTVTLTVSPRTGYELDHITVKDSAGKEVSLTSRGNGVYAFTMPAGKVSVDYSFNRTSNKPDIVNGKATFDDVPAGAWYEEAVQYAYQHGIMNGIGDNKFSPDTNLTRAMIVQVLYNLEGKPTAPQGDFEDVPADKWYADPINWAASKGIVNGYGDGNFGPEDNITREQLAAILYRYAEFKKYDVSQKGDLSKFSDAASVSEWFTEAMEWAVGAGLIQGTNEGLLMPKSTATRAQVATVMQRFCEDVID